MAKISVHGRRLIIDGGDLVLDGKPFPTPLNIYGLNSNYLKKFRAAAGKVRAGIAGGTAYRAPILFIGDSKTMGAGADGSAGNTAGAEPISKPTFLQTLLTANGLTATRNSCFGFRGTVSPAAMTLYDTRLVFGASLALSGVLASLGGYYFRLSNLAGSGGTLAFTPTGNVDTGEIYTRQSSGDGIMDVNVGAGAIATIDANGADAIIKTPLALGAAGAKTINMQRTSGNFSYVIGVRAWLSTASGFDIVNAGAYGTDSSFHADTSTAWTAIKVIPQLAPVLTFIQLGTNDLNAGTAVSTTLANITALVTAAQAAGSDVILENPTYGPDGSFGTGVQREALRLGLIALGALKGCMVVDHASRMGTYADALSNGFMGASVHEVAAGYADEARFLASALQI